MTPHWEELAWPASRIPEAMQRLAEARGLPARTAEAVPTLPRTASLSGNLARRWVESIAAWLGLETTEVDATRGDIERLLNTASPALLQLSLKGEPLFLLLIANRRQRVTLLAPDLTVRHINCRELAEFVREIPVFQPAISPPTLNVTSDAREPADAAVERIVEQAGLSGKAAERARAGLMVELYGGDVLGKCWMIRPGAGAGVTAQAVAAGLPGLTAAILGSHSCQFALWITSWWMLGWMSTRGRFDVGLFWAWLLLLMLSVPFKMLTEAVSGALSIRAGSLLKRQLLAGICRLESEEVRKWGVGQLLGRVVECEAVESMSVTGGFLILTATVELVATAIVLGLGAGHLLDVLLLFGTVFATLAIALSYYRRRQDWTQKRLSMTNDLVERMIGHRTRLAQQPRSHWNDTEDKSLETYLDSSREMDRILTRLVAIVPRGWLIVGLLGLMPMFLAGGASTVTLAVGVGGVVLGYHALRSFVDGIHRLLGAQMAWQRIRFLLDAAGRKQPEGHLFAAAFTKGDAEAAAIDPARGSTLLAAQNLTFRYRPHGRPVLDGLDLSIASGERLLLEGASGEGKSTLASILSGSRLAESGLLLLDGLDRDTLGAEGWRRRIVMAPQFHDNHVFMGPFAFNLLMGRNWPPSNQDLDMATELCRALGLGPLLDRMPGGIHQMVGETGWQLSHGEKSRMFIARAVLQQADLTILDESFAALDPHTLRLTLGSILDRATTLMVIAHP
jgi:ATP-binding cassette, subfamily B, bacterial